MTAADPKGELPPGEDDRILAGEYALGLLKADAAADFEARLAREPALRRLYAEWAEDLAGLTDELEEVAPPGGMQASIEAQLFGANPRRPFAGLRGLGWLVGGAVAAALALYVTLNAGLLGQGPTLPGAPDYTAQVAAEDGSLRILASYDIEEAGLRVEERSGTAPEGRVLELWLIAGQDAPVSLGVLPEGEGGLMPIDPAIAPRLPGGVLAISEEPRGGSPTGAPTGRVLATGAITPL
ncbi:Anti-sigma-K factor RskA [Roseovarius nanhaiticus]|uniref:Anti-sigma-K factor RskA n=1 Tax=Roseovarius nanhaiticus TaxID=573024 RepID=A0A1N7G2C1_9RHOB|nr:anti-sigma factor [Roseovarius nanhaiticus]SEK39366.1 Anti-sigma-K factor RskA [Roseovarius nanhaiticus]SIS06586.1 Anti-sigma-K factor RskA [Roseovarius nanhaiticus]